MKYAAYDKQENITALGKTIDEALNELRYLGGDTAFIKDLSFYRLTEIKVEFCEKVVPVLKEKKDANRR